MTAYCADPILHLFLDRLSLPPVVLPIFMGILITVLELIWIAPHDLIFSRDGIVGMLDDPAYYYSTWIGGFAIWFYFAWMPGGIHMLFSSLLSNKVVIVRTKDETRKWSLFIQDSRRILGMPWISVALFVISAAVAFLIYMPSIRDLSGWASQSTYGRLVVSLWIMAVLYGITQVVVRQIIVTALLRRMFKQFRLNIRPLHPDRAGGLAPLGSFAIKSTYLIAVIGFIIVFAVFNRQYQATGSFGGIRLTYELIAAMVAYLVFAPVTFLAPLSTAHRAMHEAKQDLLLNLSNRFEEAYANVRMMLERGREISGLERISTLKELYQLTEGFPVWPYNAETLRRFLVSVLFPVLLAFLPSVIGFLVQ